MTQRLLLDEHLAPAIAEQLRDRRIDAVAVAERPDLRTRSDPEILEAAASERRVLVTRNVADFVRLDAQWRAAARTPPGIVFVATRRFPEDRALIGALVMALAAWIESNPDPAGSPWFL